MGSELWRDKSVTEGEVESDNPQLAYDIFGYESATKEIRADIDQLHALNIRSDMLFEITAKLETAIECIAMAEFHLIEHRARETIERIESITSRDSGGMHQ